jgi:hypothetical protein
MASIKGRVSPSVLSRMRNRRSRSNSLSSASAAFARTSASRWRLHSSCQAFAAARFPALGHAAIETRRRLESIYRFLVGLDARELLRIVGVDKRPFTLADFVRTFASHDTVDLGDALNTFSRGRRRCYGQSSIRYRRHESWRYR